MSTLDDLLAALPLRHQQLTEKYRVMLTRNTSIVKDTLSKLWKLSNIVRDRALMRNDGDVRKSPTKVLESKQVVEEDIMALDEELEETGLEQVMEVIPEMMPD